MAVNPPFDLKAAYIEPYSKSIKLSVIEDKNDIGLSARRRRSSNPVTIHNIKLFLTHRDFKKLAEWVNNDLFGGVLSFYFTPPYSAELKTGRFSLSDGSWYSGMEMNRMCVYLNVSIEETVND